MLRLIILVGAITFGVANVLALWMFATWMGL